MKENEVAVQQGLRTEIAEEFMQSLLQSVFKEHYIEVPEGKANLNRRSRRASFRT